MSWVMSLLWRLFFSRLEKRALAFGQVTLQHVASAERGYGWQCSIRAHQNGRAPRYAWTAYGAELPQALRQAVREAEGAPMERIVGTVDRPKLGGKEFDDD